MKMLVLGMVLMSFSMFSHAKGWKYSAHYDRGYDNSAFWHNVEERQCRQEDRIIQGVDNGQLTRREARELYREKQHVNEEIRYYRNHRHLSSADKRDVMQHLNYLHRQIKYLKHNDQYVRRVQHNRYNHNPFIQHNSSVNVRNNRHYSRGYDRGSVGINFRF